MRLKKKIAAHVEEQVKDSRMLCDGCGLDVEHKDHIYHEEEVEIGARIGDVYPEGSQQTIFEVDVCGVCFLLKVVPALEAAGIKVRSRKAWDEDSDGRVWEPVETTGTTTP